VLLCGSSTSRALSRSSTFLCPCLASARLHCYVQTTRAPSASTQSALAYCNASKRAWRLSQGRVLLLSRFPVGETDLPRCTLHVSYAVAERVSRLPRALTIPRDAPPHCYFWNSFFYERLTGTQGRTYDYAAVRSWTRKVGFPSPPHLPSCASSRPFCCLITLPIRSPLGADQLIFV